MNSFLSRPFFSVADYIATFAFLLTVATAIGWLTFDVRSAIEVRAQRVYSDDGSLYVDVDRTLYHDFYGGYSVTIWSQRDGSRFCTTDYVGPTNYRMLRDDGDLVTLPDPTPLAYWAEGGTCDKRFDDGVPAGRYTMQTCHSVEWPHWYVPIRKTECWPLAFFEAP